MGLINCKECEKQYSDSLNACPHCGYTEHKKQIKSYKAFIITLCLGLACVVGVEKIFPSMIECKNEIPQKTCDCFRYAIAKNTNFLEKVTLILTGVSETELSLRLDFADTLKCGMMELADASKDIQKSLEDISNETKIDNSAQPIEDEETLRSENFTNVSEEDFTKNAEDFRRKFWYGGASIDENLRQKYWQGGLSENDLYSFCESITEPMFATRNCLEIYHYHHQTSNPYLILDASKLSDGQLKEFAMELCGKSSCENEEIKKFSDVGDFSLGLFFCGVSGNCSIGDYFMDASEFDKILEMIK